MAEDNDIWANPLVGTAQGVATGDTLDNVRSVLSFLAHVEGGDFDAEPGDKARMGKYLVIQCCIGALDVVADEAARAAGHGHG